MDEIQLVFDDFRCKFDSAEIHTITSFDCKKSIPIINKDGFCILPHYMYSNYRELRKCAEYCEENKTLLRYFDLREIIKFIEYINGNNVINASYSIDSYFTKITDITMNSLKEYYLEILLRIDCEKWSIVYNYMNTSRKQKIKPNNKILKTQSTDSKTSNMVGNDLSRSNSVSNNSKPVNSSSNGILLTTNDAYTLTDGPTIFLAEDVKKIGNFYIQQSNIAASVFQNIMMKIENNNSILEKIDNLETLITAKETKSSDDNEKESVRESGRLCKESQLWMDEINKLRKEIRLVSLDPMYVPNTKPHQNIWSPNGEIIENAFLSNIGEDVTRTIMGLKIENHMKVLLLLGIGMFVELPNIEYMEVMKQLAEQQRLFIIIASTDYIYGTNYQFCHGFIGKDLTKMTQQKTLQAMGRIGRNNIQQDYTIRFRDDAMINNLFTKPEENMEARNMCKLFCSD